MFEYLIHVRKKYRLFERIVENEKHFMWHVIIWVTSIIFIFVLSKSTNFLQFNFINVSIECGVQSVLSTGHVTSLPKMAAPGDWPWHVVLLRDDTHLCDGTLVSDTWVLTTESCFQGQPKATWLAIFGAVRLNSNAPWTQRRRIVGMIKSPVEGSTAALVRLESPVVYSDFIRPICLPDNNRNSPMKLQQDDQQLNSPRSEKLKSADSPLSMPSGEKTTSRKLVENNDYFVAPLPIDEINGSGGVLNKMYTAAFSDEHEFTPLAQAQYRHYSSIASVQNPTYPNYNTIDAPKSSGSSSTNQWTNCNTLGWSKQREHLQRVQLKIGNMAACENVSIATVNSMCTEAAYHKQDCTEEEFAGSPVICMQPDGRKWALVGIASWRIACAHVGIERPRMYDKIASNSAWIRDTIASTL